MMKRIDFNELVDASVPSKLCVSLYLPKMDNLQNQKEQEIRMQHLVKDVRNLSADAVSSKDKDIVAELQKDLPAINQLQKNHAVAWFFSEQKKGYIPTTWKKDPFAVVSDTFHVKPLLRDLQRRRPFFVLTASSKYLKLFVRFGETLDLVERVQVDLGEKSEIENFKESHRGLKGKRINRQRAIIFQLMRKYLSGSSSPLVIAGSAPMINQIQSELVYPFAIKHSIPCNPERIGLEELYLRANELVEFHYDELECRVLEEFDYFEESKKVLTDIHDIAHAVVQGRVDQLIIAQDHHIWGEMNLDNGDLIIHSKQITATDDDILDDLSESVFRQKGVVWVMPKEKLGKHSLYAKLRW